MTDLRTAAQQALEALELIQDADTAGATPKMVVAARAMYAPTITALRAALAEPVPDSKHTTVAEWQANNQRTPLTGEEIDQIAIKCLASPVFDPGWNRNLARAIERAHGIV